VFQLIANFLAAIYGLVNNYAIAIALLTIAIMIVVTPLTLKSTKSMLEMQRIQPEMKRLQAQYKNDRQKLNEEMMALYREHKINPLGGCLPILLQAPVFIIMYRVLRGLTRLCNTGVGGEVAHALGVTKLSCTPGTIHPGYIKQSSKLFTSLDGKKEMLSFGLDLAKPALKVIGESFVRGLPYLALVLLVAVSSYYQQRQISARGTNQPVNPQQQMILRVMPALFGIISLTFPSGLIVYFLVQNIFRIGQNAYITRKFYAEPPPSEGEGGRPPKVVDVPDKPKPTGPKGGNGAAPKRPTPPRPAPKGRVTPPKPASGSRPSPRPKRPEQHGDRPAPRPGGRPAPKKK
jgi:YidC/Oxa1 family membrane protein insertase